jgi:hypothetical protein
MKIARASEEIALRGPVLEPGMLPRVFPIRVGGVGLPIVSA